MDTGTTYIDTRISNNFNPNILPPGGWHSAEVCGEAKTNKQPGERLWNTVLVKEPPGSQNGQPKPQQRWAPAAKLSEPALKAHRNHFDPFSFDKVQNWTISQIDDSRHDTMRRSFPQKAIVGPSTVQAAASPTSSAPFPQNPVPVPQSPVPVNDKKVRFSMSDEVIQELSSSYEQIPFDPDEKRAPASGGIQAVSFNAEKLQGWTIMSLKQFPVPSDMLEKQDQIPGEMFITYVENGMLKIVFLQKPSEFLQRQYDDDTVQSDEGKKQNGVPSSEESANKKGQKRFSISSKFSEDTRRESQNSNVSVSAVKGFSNHRDSMKTAQSANNRRESQLSSTSNSDRVPRQKEPVDRQMSHVSLAGSIPDWSWQPNGDEHVQMAAVQSSTTTGAGTRDENPPAPTQVVVNGQHYYVTKQNGAPAPTSTLRKVDSTPPSTIQPVGVPEPLTGPPNRPPPSYEVLDTVPKLPFDDNASLSSIRTNSTTTSSVRAAISATEDVLVQVTKGEGRSLHVNVRPPEGMSSGDIEVDLDLSVLDEKEEREPIIEALEAAEPKMMEELIVEERRKQEGRSIEEETKETARIDDRESITSSSSSENRRNKEKKKMRWSNIAHSPKPQRAAIEDISSEATITESIKTSRSSAKKGMKKTSKLMKSGQEGFAKLTSKFKKVKDE